jgi:UDP-glucuronate 4-epimerase
MRYLVTGAAGFIGSRISQLLLDAGHEVVGIDNLNTAYDPRLKRWRLAHLTRQQGFQFHQIDITDAISLDLLFKSRLNDIHFAAVFNLAAMAGVQPSVSNPYIYLRVNSEGTLTLLEMCRQHGIPKFVLASTSSLYGANNSAPFSEEDLTDRPLSPYAASKKAAEAFAYTYHHLHGIDISVLRYFTVYGPAGRPDMSVFRFIQSISEGSPITLFGDGEQQRDFTYIDDIAAGTVAAVKPVGFEVINLGGNRLTTVNTLIQQISQLVGREPIIRQRPAHSADMPITYAKVDKASQLLGWSPKISLEEGLRRTVAWYQEHRDLAASLEINAPVILPITGYANSPSSACA